MNTIADRVKEIRKEQNLTQKQFGERIGVSDVHISKIESGKNIPSDSLIKLMSYEYNINFDWIKSGTGDKYNDFLTDGKEELRQNVDTLMIQYTDKINKLLKSITDDTKVEFSYCLNVFTDIFDIDFIKEDYHFNYLNIIRRLLQDLSMFTMHLKFTAANVNEENAYIKTQEIEEMIKKYLKTFSYDFEDLSHIYIKSAANIDIKTNLLDKNSMPS